MRTVLQHIDRVKERPHHVRRRIAFGTATVLASAIALVWLGTSLATGAFAIQGATFAEANGVAPVEAVADAGSGASGVAAVAATAVATETPAPEPAPAPIEVIPTKPKASRTSSGPTVIPF